MGNNANFRVQTLDVNSSSEKIHINASNIENAYKNVFSKLRMIDSAWDGEDNSAYNEKFKSFEKDFVEIIQFLEEFQNHLSLTAKAYDTIESATAKSAQRLSY